VILGKSKTAAGGFAEIWQSRRLLFFLLQNFCKAADG
jgi:hypothetical protein